MYKKRLEIYRENYDNEIKYKSELNSRLKSSYTIAIILFGILSFLIEKVNIIPLEINNTGYLPLNISFFIYLFGILFFSGFLVIVVLKQIECYHGNEYDYMPNSDKMEKYYNDYNDFYNSVDDPSKYNDVETEFYECLIENYCKSNKHNRKINKIRSNSLYKANKYIVFCLIAATITVLPIAYNGILSQKEDVNLSKIIKEQKIEIEQFELGGDKNG